MPYQQLNQAIPKIYKQLFSQHSTLLSTGVSIQFLGRKLEVVSLYDSAVGSGPPTERKRKSILKD
jgi:hypothetical protein